MQAFQPEQVDLDEIFEAYTLSSKGVQEVRIQLNTPANNQTIQRFPEYVHLTHNELSDLFESVQIEIDKTFTLTLFTAIEGFIQRDFRGGRSKQGEFRKLQKSVSTGQYNVEEILDTWKFVTNGTPLARNINKLKSILNLRHWLAHGRYFVPMLPSWPGFSPDELLVLGSSIIQGINAFP